MDLTNCTLLDLAKMTVAIRVASIDNHGVDITSNQNFNTAVLTPVLGNIDPTYTVSLTRNGIDYTYVERGITQTGEMKSCNLRSGTTRKTKKTGTFTFHALVVLANKDDSYLFYTHDDSKPKTIYDFRKPDRVAAVHDILTKHANNWMDKVVVNPAAGKRDTVMIKEDEVRSLFDDIVPVTIEHEGNHITIYSDNLDL